MKGVGVGEILIFKDLFLWERGGIGKGPLVGIRTRDAFSAMEQYVGAKGVVLFWTLEGLMCEVF